MFETKYKEAFGQEEIAEFDICRKLFDLYNAAITPRKIIAFINDLVTYKLIWKDEIKLKYIAVFVLNRQRIVQDPLKQILNKKFLDQAQNIFTGDENVSDNIAALFYNVQLSKAIQVTLQREIEIAIREKNVEYLNELSKNADFFSVLEQIPTEDIDVDASSLCLNEIESSIENKNGESIQIIWDRILGRQIHLETEEHSLNDTHKILIQRVRPYQLKALVKYLINKFNLARMISGSQYYLALKDLEKAISERDKEFPYLSYIPLKQLDSAQFIDYLKASKEMYIGYKVSADNNLLETFYLQSIPEHFENFTGIEYLKDEYNFKNLKEKVENIIKADDVTKDSFLSIFNIYKVLTKGRILNEKISDSKILELLPSVQINSDEYYELLTMSISRGSKFQVPNSLVDSALQQNDEKLTEQISFRIQSYIGYSNLLLESLVFSRPLLKSVLKLLTLSDRAKVINIEKIIEKFEPIITEIGVDAGQMLNTLNPGNKTLKDKLTVEDLNVMIPDIIVFREAVLIENNLSETIITYAIKYIEQASQPEYASAFMDSESYLFNILFILLQSQKIKELPDNAFLSYKEALKSIANSTGSEYLTSMNKIKWDMLYSCSDRLHLQPVIKDIRDMFLEKIDVSIEQFLFFETALRELGSLEDRAGDVVRKILVPLLTNAGSQDLILGSREYYASLIVSAGNDAFGFIDRLRELIENSPGSALTSLENSVNLGLSKRIHIIYSKYGAESNPDNFIDTTETLKRIVEKEGQLHFMLDNGIINGKDPEPGSSKNLFVKYSYDSIEKDKSFEENKWVRLP